MSKKRKSAAAPAETAAKKEKKSGRAAVFGHPVRNLIVTAIISIVLGVAFIVKPYEVSVYCGYGVGGLIALVGLVYIVIYFVRKPVSGEYRSEFAIGLLAMLAGAYVALSGLITGGSGVGYVLVIAILGVLIVADGLMKLQYSIDIARMKFPRWWLLLIFAVLGIGVGIITVTDFSNTARAGASVPPSMLYKVGGNMGLVKDKGSYNTFYSGMMALGIGFCLNGVLDLAAMIVIIVRNRKAAKAAAIEEAAALMVEAQKAEAAASGKTAPAEKEPPVEEVVFVVNDQQPDPQPVFPAAQDPAPMPAPEPVMPDPVPATPADGQ